MQRAIHASIIVIGLLLLGWSLWLAARDYRARRKREDWQRNGPGFDRWKRF